jgi:hypothetical protein
MSKYVKQLDNGKHVAYGFDVALGYFIDVVDVPDEEGEEQYLLEESSLLTKMGNGKMIELMSLYNLPESHIEQVASDLPIT